LIVDPDVAPGKKPRPEQISRDCLRTFAAAMLCARNMTALIPPGCAVIHAAKRSVPATTPWDGAPAAVFFDCHPAQKNETTIERR
jgi:hypothetical protein